MRFSVYITAVKLLRFFLAIAVIALPLRAADEQNVTVKSSSIEKSAVRVIADLQGKPTELDCSIGVSSCSQPQPGEYRMRPAAADEGVYNDCTNVVLLKSHGAAKEKIGVYCWANEGDCFIARCSKVQVETIPAAVTDTALEPRPVALDFSSAFVAEPPSVQQRLAQNRDSEEVLVWAPVKKACGRLRMLERGVFVPAPNRELHLYEEKWRKPCCKDLKLVGTRITSEDGDFDFGDIKSGRYWVTVELDGVQHGTPIDVDARHYWQGSCDTQGPDIEKNSINWGSVTPSMY